MSIAPRIACEAKGPKPKSEQPDQSAQHQPLEISPEYLDDVNIEELVLFLLLNCLFIPFLVQY
jgi:hypothetical protein